MKANFPYPYYYYGSSDSLDIDVLIQIPKEMLPPIQEDRKRLIKKLEIEWELKWNANFIVVENGIVVDTIYPKTWVDSINNSLLTTYSLHEDKQVYPLPILHEVKRNKLLAVYKTVRTILSMLSRSHYRKILKPILKGVHPFHLKVEALKQIDFTTLNGFNQENTPNKDIWKIIAFYLGQNISLVKDDNEIYSKSILCVNYPELTPFIYREEITHELKVLLNEKLKYYIDTILVNYANAKCKNGVMELDGEIIDMKNEISL